jgi:putative phosphoribosyl transferase
MRIFFKDRSDAGRQLAESLRRFAGTDPVVLALPRGGVPVAFEVAKTLAAPLDVLLVRKIGAPGQEELALGAVVDGTNPETVINDEVVRLAAPPPGYIEAETKRQLDEIERRRQLYRGNEPALDVKGHTAIVIDDGIATGATVKAALSGIARSKPQYLVLAVPVAPSETLDELAGYCNEIVCLHSPDPFYAVGVHYVDFSQTSDEEVIGILAESRANASTG